MNSVKEVELKLKIMILINVQAGPASCGPDSCPHMKFTDRDLHFLKQELLQLHLPILSFIFPWFSTIMWEVSPTETVFVRLPIHLFKLSVTGAETLEPVQQVNNRGAHKLLLFDHFNLFVMSSLPDKAM